MSWWSKIRQFEPHFDFVRWRFVNFAVSAAMLIGAIVAVAAGGLNYGLDFTGGLAIEARSQGPVDIGALRAELGALPIGETKLQGMDDPRDVLIRVQLSEQGEKAQQAAIAVIKQKLGGEFDFRQVEIIGPTVGAELLRNGVLASVLAAIGIGAYVAFRFEWRFGVSALVRTIHELMVTVGFFALLDLEFNLTAIAALLALAGYSINDTVVVFDRIREISRKRKSAPMGEIINLAINQTLRRTVILSVCMEIVLLPLVIYGGRALFNFSLSLLWGVLLGTYTSIFVAGPLIMHIAHKPRIAEGKARPATS
jgi:preprotein translocase subunit SecF